MQRFYKYQGAGNDFIIFDNRSDFFDSGNRLMVNKLCDRRFGIGADGLMLLQDRDGYDFEMVYFNADGKAGSMCGNGGRCIVAFAHSLSLFDTKTVFLAVDGEHTAYLTVGESALTVKLRMNDVSAIVRDSNAYVLDTGSPHYVQEVQHLSRFPLMEEARKIRYGEKYGQQGINVNYVEALEGGGYAIRTYERGVEDETLACGTGATAAALAMALNTFPDGQHQTLLEASGGRLTIHFHKRGEQFTEVYLEGPAAYVFEGTVDLEQFKA